MKKATTTITERDYIIISKGLSHLMDEYKNDKKIDQKYIKEIENLKLKLVEPFNGISMNNSINKNTP
jgi:predicted class III extradiol MEMO1 family dioxygenase